jgi:hypothetical protein
MKPNYAKPTHTNHPRPNPKPNFRKRAAAKPTRQPQFSKISKISKMFHGTFINIYSSKTSFSDRNDQNPRV